jgi:propionyl-CoA carboxylase alpha chain
MVGQDKSFYVTVQGESVRLDVVEVTDSAAQFRIGEHNHAVHGQLKPGQALQQLTIDGYPVRFRVEETGGRLTITRRGKQVSTRAMTALEHDLYALMPVKQAADTSNLVLSPMPGKVIAVYVEAGQAVKAGEALCVIEAMKMENVLYAERDGTVVRLDIAAGQTVDADQLLIEFERAAPGAGA